jgi:hypothetical protein
MLVFEENKANSDHFQTGGQFLKRRESKKSLPLAAAIRFRGRQFLPRGFFSCLRFHPVMKIEVIQN